MLNQRKCLLSLVNLSRGNYDHESEEEWFFACWCKELIERGIILEAYRPDTIHLRSALDFTHQLAMKTKTKNVSFSLVKPSTYNGDMFIRWNPEYKGIFYVNVGDTLNIKPSPLGGFCKKHHMFYCVEPDVSWVDVKGTFLNSSQQSFSRTQQLLAAFGYYVQKVIPLGKKGLFMKTFAPKEYLYTPVRKQKRIGFRSLDSFLDATQNILVTDEN